MCELHNHGHGHGSANASATLTVAATTMDQQVQLEGPIYKQLYAEQSNKHLRYACIQWYVIAAILLALAVLRVARVSRQTARLARRIERFWCKTSLCGQDLHTTRAQFATLLVYVLYNLVFTFVDVPYGHSYHYVSSHAKGYVQKATTLQFIANRTGFLAFAGIPLIFLLVARLGVVRVLTGVSYHHLNLAHKWVGWTVLVLSWLHATLWTIEMGLHYQMEGGYLATRWRKIYWIAGCFATVFLSYMTIHSFAAIRRNTGYEFFRITHNLGSILFLIGCWVHWTETFQWIAAALAIYFADRLARYCTLGLHYFRAGRKSSLSGQVFTDEDGVSVAKITIQDSGLGAWYPGQHIYMTCISRAEWQPHPFTVANCGKGTEDLHLIIRRKSGMTQDLVDYLSCEKASVRVLLEGPHGGIERAQLLESHILLIVGGTGISFALSVLDFISKTTRTSQHKIKLVWYIRRNGTCSTPLKPLQV